MANTSPRHLAIMALPRPLTFSETLQFVADDSLEDAYQASAFSLAKGFRLCRRDHQIYKGLLKDSRKKIEELRELINTFRKDPALAVHAITMDRWEGIADYHCIYLFETVRKTVHPNERRLQKMWREDFREVIGEGGCPNMRAMLLEGIFGVLADGGEAGKKTKGRK
jgi:hypothetical protein